MGCTAEKPGSNLITKVLLWGKKICPIDTLTAEGVYYVTRKLRFQLYKDECFRKPTLLMLHLHIPIHSSPKWIRESFLGDPPGLSPSQPGELSRSTPALVKRMVDNGINAHLLKGSSKSDPGDYWDGTPSPSLWPLPPLSHRLWSSVMLPWS